VSDLPAAEEILPRFLDHLQSLGFSHAVLDK
jgi:hypothetical protein